MGTSQHRPRSDPRDGDGGGGSVGRRGATASADVGSADGSATISPSSAFERHRDKTIIRWRGEHGEHFNLVFKCAQECAALWHRIEDIDSAMHPRPRRSKRPRIMSEAMLTTPTIEQPLILLGTGNHSVVYAAKMPDAKRGQQPRKVAMKLAFDAQSHEEHLENELEVTTRSARASNESPLALFRTRTHPVPAAQPPGAQDPRANGSRTYRALVRPVLQRAGTLARHPPSPAPAQGPGIRNGPRRAVAASAQGHARWPALPQVRAHVLSHADGTTRPRRASSCAVCCELIVRLVFA